MSTAVSTPATSAAGRYGFQNRLLPVPTVVGVFFGLWAGTIAVRITVLHVQVPTLMFLLGVASALLGAVALPRSAEPRRPNLVDLMAFVYLVGRGLDELVSSHLTDHPAAYNRVEATAYVVVAYYCVRLVVRDRASFRRFVGALALPTVPIVALGALQAAEYGPAVRWVLVHTSSLAAANRYSDGRLTRATSTIGHWSALGGYLCCIIGIGMVCIAMDRAEHRRVPFWQLVCIGAALLGLVTTFTVAPIVIGLLVVLVGAVASRRTLLALSGVIAGGFVVFEFFGTSISSRVALQAGGTTRLADTDSWVPATLAARISIWSEETVPAWLQQPWFGWGHAVYDQPENWPRFPSTIVWQSPESEYLKALVMGGVVELILLVLLMLTWGWTILHVSARLGRTSRTVLLTLFIGLLVGSVVNPYFSNPGLPALWWPFMAALGWAGAGATRAGPDPAAAIRVDEVPELSAPASRPAVPALAP